MSKKKDVDQVELDPEDVARARAFIRENDIEPGSTASPAPSLEEEIADRMRVFDMTRQEAMESLGITQADLDAESK